MITSQTVVILHIANDICPKFSCDAKSTKALDPHLICILIKVNSSCRVV